MPRPSRVADLAALPVLLVALAPLLAGCVPPGAGSQRGTYVVDADGTGLIRVADGTPNLAWSRDGTALALVGDDHSIKVVNVDGSETSVSGDGPFVGPGWSPDGTRVAAIDSDQGLVEVRTLDGATVATAPLLDDLPPNWMVTRTVDEVPVWSPDGQKIAFVAWDGNGDELYVVRSDGTDREQLTETPTSRNAVARYGPSAQRAALADVGAPAWSPDGDVVAFAIYPDVSGATGGIALVTEDGLRRYRITGLVPTSGPVWSPDGRKLAFTSRQGTQTDLYVVNANGTRLTNLTQTFPSAVQDPAWSPDGSRIAFSADGDIYVMSANGLGRTRLAATPLKDTAPVWSPDGSKIAFRSEPPQPGVDLPPGPTQRPRS